jgi:type II secretory pathway pseudopilin PulG
MNLRRRGEGGFTLPELIVAVALETIIFGALATAFVVVLNGGDSVNDNLNKSSDARFAANYIISDARNSSGPEISLTDTTTCPDANPPVAGPQTAVARFNWSSPNAAGTTTANIANYVVASGSLMRRHCEAGVLVSDGVLATAVDTVAVSCAPIANCSGKPTSITVTITELPDKAASPIFSYTLTAAFRKLVGGGSPLTPSPPQSLVVLGSGGCGVSISGSGFVRVYGNAFINTADSGACRALTLGGSGSWNAGTTSILTGGSCVASGGAVCPPVTSYSPPIVDPYAGLAAPSTAGRPAQTGCTGPVGAQTAQPGVYGSQFSVSDTCTLASGIYILQAGWSLGSGAVVNTGAGGVLIYITGGAFSVGGGASLTVTAMTTGTYAGLSLWQAAADTSTISFGGGGTIIFRGALYAPTAELNITGNGQTPIATAIVVNTIVIGGTGSISIGASAVPLSITAPATLQPWTVNRPYPSTTVTPAGGDGSYAWSATGFPNDLAINANTGVISGTPTVAGTASVVVTLNDALGDDSATKSYSLTINAGLAITTVSPLPGGQQGIAYSTTVARTGGTAAYVWSATGTPVGLSINASTGVISGTPTATGTSTVSVTLTDAAGASVSKDLLLTITVAVAAPTISSVTLTNAGATAGRIEAGDKITVVFSAQMRVSSICSTWATDTSNQALSGNNDVTVVLTDGISPTHDVLSVTSATCTFNFGTLDLGVSTYVGSGSVSFAGSSANKSTIAWTASTFTLVITLGAQGGTGTVATVASSTPVYTAGAIKDSAGTALGNSPFTLAAGQKF